jgi:hypothetical protein
MVVITIVYSKEALGWWKKECDKKLGHKTNKTQIIYIQNGKYIFKVSHWHEPDTT